MVILRLQTFRALGPLNTRSSVEIALEKESLSAGGTFRTKDRSKRARRTQNIRKKGSFKMAEYESSECP